MDCFFQPDIQSGINYLDEIDSYHCTRVLRKGKGDEILVLDGKGSKYHCDISDADPKKVVFFIRDTFFENSPSYSIHIALAPTKNPDRMNWFIEKSVEIGIQEISFMKCSNSERPRINLNRLSRKMISALKQSQNVYLPVLHDLRSFNGIVEQSSPVEERFICHADNEDNPHLMNIVKKSKKYLVLIGPEGGFTPAEVDFAQKKGFMPVTLGKSRLRTETASLVACVMLNSLQIKQ